jgi:hypothetical protein
MALRCQPVTLGNIHTWYERTGFDHNANSCNYSCGAVRLSQWDLIVKRHTLRPANDLSNIKESRNGFRRAKPKTWEQSLSQCHFVRNKRQWTDLGKTPGLRDNKPPINRLCSANTCITSCVMIRTWAACSLCTTHIWSNYKLPQKAP